MRIRMGCGNSGSHKGREEQKCKRREIVHPLKTAPRLGNADKHSGVLAEV